MILGLILFLCPAVQKGSKILLNFSSEFVFTTSGKLSSPGSMTKKFADSKIFIIFSRIDLTPQQSISTTQPYGGKLYSSRAFNS